MFVCVHEREDLVHREMFCFLNVCGFAQWCVCVRALAVYTGIFVSESVRVWVRVRVRACL